MKIESKIALGCMFLQSAGLLATDNAAKPNILLIVTDQQSFNTISALRNAYPNHDTYSTTPNIDRLVNSGIAFTNTYCANPVSVPSRFAMFTGLYGGKYNVRDNRLDLAVQTNVQPALNTYAMGNVFKADGYQTYYAGKVHLPFATASGGMFGHPVNYGFTEYISDDDRNILGKDVANFIKNRTSTNPFLLVASFINPHDICLESSTNLSSTPDVDPKKPEISQTINLARQAADAVSVSTYPALPFNQLKTTGFPATFTPSVFDNFPNDYWRRYRYIYSWLVSLVDSHIGDVLNALDASALKNNTIIVFTSDHGEMQGAHTATVKNLPFEECMRVPFIIAGPGIVQNQRDNSLICNGTDLLPTICELAGIDKPSGLTGISLAQRAKGTSSVAQRQYLYLEGDDFSNVIENPDYKFTQFHITGNPEMLIDMKTDVGELTNIASKNATYSAKSTELRSILTSAIANGGIKTSVKLTSKPEFFISANSNQLQVSGLANNSTLKLFDIRGNCCVNTKISTENQTVDMSKLQKGIYIISTEKGSQKLIKY